MKTSYKTSDIAFAAFLVKNGQKISSIDRKGRKVSWIFDMEKSELNRLEAVWPSSPSAEFYNKYKMLKIHLKK